MDKRQVAAALEEIATLLELTGGNMFQLRAYTNAARLIESLDEDLGALVASGALRELKGIGPALADKITTLVTTGGLPYLDDLRAQVPAGLLDVMRVPGLGPKKAKLLHEQAGVESLETLEAAVREGRLKGLSGFGPKTEANILAGIERLRTAGGRVLYPIAAAEAERLLAIVRAVPGVQRCEVGGSVRRRRETAKDIDLVCAAPAECVGAVMDAVTGAEGVVAVVGRGETKCSVQLAAGLNADVRVVRDEAYVATLAYFTGSKEHNVAMRSRAIDRGLKLNEYGLFRGDEALPLPDEAALYAALDLPYIEPELREDHGEFEAAAAGALPRLVREDDIRGVLHNHSTWSDGENTLEEMVAEAERLGYTYLGMSEHSKSAAYARGLEPARLLDYLDTIDALNAAPERRIRILKGTECDILADGALDYDDALLARFDFVVASVHSRFKMEGDAMTARILAAVRNPFTTILGHPTGRLLLERDPYNVDMDAVLAEAARCDVAVELDAHPSRLDLDWRHGKVVRKLGVKIAIDPDAHAIEGLRDVRYGVGIARKMGLQREQVLNAMTVDELTRWLASRRAARA